MTSPIDLQDKLRQLRVLPSETEWIEFKEVFWLSVSRVNVG